MASNKPPALGGEMRNVTVYFSDIADFSAFAEKIPPAELVAAMNAYLSAMTDIIEAHGGFVDKYIGDAIVAVFGAPLDDPDHATQRGARRAAMRRDSSAELDRIQAAFEGRALRQRIGLNSGEALVGNIGSRRRFNYTVMGDMVNLASRLEGANKVFGTTIMASETTVALAGDGVRVARARRDPRQGPRQRGEDLRAARRGRRGAAGRGVAGARPMPRPRALSRPRFRRRRGSISRNSPPTIRPRRGSWSGRGNWRDPARPGLGAGQHAGGEVAAGIEPPTVISGAHAKAR